MSKPSVTSRRVVEDLRWGAERGFFLACVCSVIVLVQWFMGARLTAGSTPIEMSRVLTLYFAGGPFVGALVGLARRFARTRVRAMLAGLVVFVPFTTIGISTLAGLPWHWTTGQWIGATILVLFGGPAAGAILWDPQP